MTHVRYDLWHTLINNISTRHFDHKPAILELGGGTGVLGRLLLKSGYTYYGSDYSFAMCKEAQKKDVPFICADALYMPIKKLFDLVIFLYDGINYFETLEQYHCLFNEIHKHIDKNGYFLFDITTETNSLSYFADIVDSDSFGTITYTRHSYYNKKNKIQNNDFTIYLKHPDYGELHREAKEHHSQKIFSVKEISDTIPKNLFSISGIWDNFTFNKYRSESERIHFFIQKR
jgi:ubiquinone/menaquinone biosynthesis C-methylase UbiE